MKDLKKLYEEIFLNALTDYQSPIKIYVNELKTQWGKELENNIFKAVQEYCIKVDRDELEKALNYDRSQYEKGFNHGYFADKWKSVKEQLPFEDEQVLVCNKYGHFETARYSSCWKKVWELADKRYFLEDFPYWQRLPRLPKEISDENNDD